MVWLVDYWAMVPMDQWAVMSGRSLFDMSRRLVSGMTTRLLSDETSLGNGVGGGGVGVWGVEGTRTILSKENLMLIFPIAWLSF